MAMGFLFRAGSEARQGIERRWLTAGLRPVPSTGQGTLLLEQLSSFGPSILPSWGPGCPDGNSFCPLSSSGQEKGCFGVCLGVCCVRIYPL